MRLLNTHTLQLEEFIGDTESIAHYAILSHTWEKEEVTFPDMSDLDKARAKAGFAKVRSACILAESQGFDYIWIDTCCIDKSSSAELSEAINSMYQWYRWSSVCYAYLCDVDNMGQVEGSRWFTRGWTLQELIAPARAEFYNKDWDYIGEKQDPGLLSTISRASLVDEYVLGRVVKPRDVSVAKRMYWASKRRTTRIEDEAYCLMGLFDVNMPLLYGEGRRAFIRLQQEISKVTNDQSILAWYCDSVAESEESGMSSSWAACCAPSPRCFSLSGNIVPLPEMDPAGILGHVNFSGTLTELTAVILQREPDGQELEVVLACQIGPIPGTFPTLVLRQRQGNPGHYTRIFAAGVVSHFTLHSPGRILSHRGLDHYTGPSDGTRSNGPTSDGLHSRRLLGLTLSPGGQQHPRGMLVMIRGALGDTEDWFLPSPERVTIWKTIVHAPHRDRSPSIRDRPAIQPWLPERIRVFWLVPLRKRGSRITVSVFDVYPVKHWDSGSHQFMWSPLLREPLEEDLTITAGVARIGFDMATQEEEEEEEANPLRLGTAILAFGLRPVSSEESGHIVHQPWCRLLEDVGVYSLEDYFHNQHDVPDQDTQRHSLSLAVGVVANAWVTTANVSGGICELVKLWAVEEVNGRSDGTLPAEVAGYLWDDGHGRDAA